MLRRPGSYGIFKLMEAWPVGEAGANQERTKTSVEAGSLSVRLVTLDIADAAALLARARPGGRENAAVARGYAEAMQAGRWVFNGMPILLSRSDQLLDGYHRLKACVLSGLPLTVFLVEGVRDDVLHTVDQHRRRSFANVLEARGTPHAHAVQSLLIKLLQYEDGLLGARRALRPGWARMDEALAANTDIPVAASDSLALASRIIPEPVRTPLLFMGRRVDAVALERLFRAVDDPQAHALDEPGVLLRHELDRGREDATQRISTIRALALALIAFNATRKGQPLRRLNWAEQRASGKPGDPFPRVEDYGGLARMTPSANPAPAAPHGDGGPAADGVSWAMETINRDKALRYLAANTHNRRVVQAHVDGITRDIMQGRWMLNAQPICFSRTDRLLNGQHRLMAVVAADGVIQAPVVRGVADAAQSTYDIQARRLPEFGAGLESFGDKALLAAMANLLITHEMPGRGRARSKATASDLHAVVKAHPGLVEQRGYARKMVDFGRASVIGYGAYVILREDPERGVAFLKALETGAGLPEGHPILALRLALQRLRRAKASQEEQLQALLQGWGRYRGRAS